MLAPRPIRFSFILTCLAASLVPTSRAQGGQQGPPPVTPNILVVLLDDVGVDPLRLYNALLAGSWTGECSFESPTPRPCLDSLDEIARHGIAFTEAWSNPTCSATRAALLTGRYGFRTGIGKPIKVGSGFNLCDSELLLPEVLGSRYTCGAFGKWHLSSALDAFQAQAEGYPWMNGFDHFEGQLHPVIVPYCPVAGVPMWLEVESSPTLVEQSPDMSSYLVEEHFLDAQAWIQSAQEPWFCYLAPQGPGGGYPQWPPQQYGTCSPVAPADSCTFVNGGSTPRRAAYDATLEAADHFLGNLLDQLDWQAAQVHPSLHWWDTTTIFFVGDNGTPPRVARLPFNPLKAKESLYEGGVRVPFVVAGWGVSSERWGDHSQELVSVVDVFSTVCSLASVSEPNRTIDGINLRPYMSARPASGLRTFSYAEKWNNGYWSCYGGGSSPDRVYRSTTYGVNWKIHYSNSPTQSVFYDLAADPCERIPFLWDDPVVQPFQAGLWSEVALLLDPATCDNFCK